MSGFESHRTGKLTHAARLWLLFGIVMHWVQLTDAWHAFFHAPETCAPQVLFRLLLGGLMLLNAVLLFPLVTDFFGADAMWSISAWQNIRIAAECACCTCCHPRPVVFVPCW